jgi:hypothetical protein
MLPHRSSSPFTLLCFAGLSAAAFAAEYLGPSTSPTESPTTAPAAPATPSSPASDPTDPGLPALRRLPPNAFETTPGFGVPVRSIFRDTRAPYYDNLRNVELTPTVRPADTVQANARVDLPDFRGGFPLLQRGFAPEDADLKIGPVYFKLRHISAGVLYSDNVRLSEENRKADGIAIVSIGGQILAQLTEGFHIAAYGNLVYFPFKSQGGVDGYALRAPYSFGLQSAPAARSQVVWAPTVFGLPLTIADEFRIGLARFRTGTEDGFALFEGFDVDESDRAGIYYFRPPPTTTGDNFKERQNSEDLEFLYYSNRISLNTGGPFIGQTVFQFYAAHENIWFDDDQDTSNLPSERDVVVASVRSVRENLRFKPYVRYQFHHRDEPDRSSHTLWVGAEGPVTDLMRFRGEVGAFWQADTGDQTLLWRLGLHHNPSPYTEHAFQYARVVSDFDDEIDQYLVYRIQKTLGPSLSASLYTSYHWIDDLEDSSFDREEWRSGLDLTYLASPRTTFRFVAQEISEKIDTGSDDFTAFRLRGEWLQRFGQHTRMRLIYQYQQKDSDRRFRSFAENVAYLSFSYLFD